MLCRRLGRHLASLPYSQKDGPHPFRSRGGKVRTRLLGKGRVAREENKMNKITLLAGIAIGAVLTAGVAQLQAQAPPAAANDDT